MVIYAGSGSPSAPSAGEQAGASAFMGSGATGATAGQVYMGSIRLEGKGYTPTYRTKKEALTYFDANYNGKQLQDFIAAGQAGGLLKEGAGFMEAQALWKKLVDASASLTAAGNNISPQDVLAGYLGNGRLATAALGEESLWQTQFRGGRKFLVNTQTGEVKYQGPKFETTYQKSVDLTDPTTAKAIATSMFQQLMHRDPGKGEMSGFASALRAAEEASPVVTNTTTEYDPVTGEAIGQTAESTGGLTADARAYLAEQQIKKSKEYGAVQSATTYANALESAIFNNPYGSL